MSNEEKKEPEMVSFTGTLNIGKGDNGVSMVPTSYMRIVQPLFNHGNFSDGVVAVRLMQLWVEPGTNNSEWRDVPIVKLDIPPGPSLI